MLGGRRSVLACVLAISAAVVTPAPTHAFPYVAKRGDTLATIALRFYGRVDREKLLVAANSLDDVTALAPGTRLEVPAVSHHTVAPGETWESLGEAYFGDPKRSEALALANDTMPWIPVETGREIVVPYVLRYVARPGDSTPSVSYSFLGRRDDAMIVDRFNFLKGRALKPGDVLLLPVADLALTDDGKAAARAGLASVEREGGGGDRDAQLRADRELPLLGREVAQGHWIKAIARGNQLVGAGDLADAQAARVHRLLLEAYVAVDEVDLARAACEEWRRADPESQLDPIETSPKVLRACAGAAGGVRHGAIGEDPPPRPSASASGRPRARPPAGEFP